MCAGVPLILFTLLYPNRYHIQSLMEAANSQDKANNNFAGARRASVTSLGTLRSSLHNHSNYNAMLTLAVSDSLKSIGWLSKKFKHFVCLWSTCLTICRHHRRLASPSSALSWCTLTRTESDDVVDGNLLADYKALSVLPPGDMCKTGRPGEFRYLKHSPRNRRPTRDVALPTQRRVRDLHIKSRMDCLLYLSIFTLASLSLSAAMSWHSSRNGCWYCGPVSSGHICLGHFETYRSSLLELSLC